MTGDQRRVPISVETVEPHMCTVAERLRLLSGVPFLAGLDMSAIAGINARFHEYGFMPGERIYWMGDPAARPYVVARGKVKLLGHSSTGQDIVLDLLLPGDVFGSVASIGDDEYRDTAQAHTSCCVLGIAAQDFQAVLQAYPSVALAMLEYMSRRLGAAREMARQLASASIESRIASTLLMLGARLGESRDGMLLIQLPLSRQDLADMTGATVETASRVMSQFRKQGLIRSGRGWVAVADRERLALIAAKD